MLKHQVPETFDEALGLVIRTKRESKKLTQDDFALKLRTLSLQAFRRREAGESVWGVMELIDVCAALKVTLGDVIRLATLKLAKSKPKAKARKKAA